MKKILLALMITLCLSTANVLASENSNSNTEEVKDEQTPEAGRKDNLSMIYMAGAAILVVLVGGVAMQKKSQPKGKLYISGVENNEDGTYTVKCGVHALHNLSDYTGQSEIQIKKGNAIVIKNELGKSDDKEAFITIVDEQTELDWVLGEESLKINKESIHNKK